MQEDNRMALSKSLLPVLVALAISGCASSPDGDDLGLPQPIAYEDVAVLEGEPGGAFKELGNVRGAVCYRSSFEFELKSRDAAIRDMRRQATELGADAIIRLQCQSRKKRDWLKNCLATMNCTGVAVLSGRSR